MSKAALFFNLMTLVLLAVTPNCEATNRKLRNLNRVTVSENCKDFLEVKEVKNSRLKRRLEFSNKALPSQVERCGITLKAITSEHNTLGKVTKRKSSKAQIECSLLNTYETQSTAPNLGECFYYSFEVAFKKSLDSKPSITIPPIDINFDACADLTSELESHLKAARNCSVDSDCGAPLPGTGCGGTRNICANKSYNSSDFISTLHQATEVGCFIPFAMASICDLPEATPRCINNKCTWEYTEHDGSKSLDPR